jgi:chromosome transmission fidelity protein 1
MATDIELSTPEDFPAFPFQPPYDIQVQLMRHLYTSIEGKKVTIVESPTGTVCTHPQFQTSANAFKM